MTGRIRWLKIQKSELSILKEFHTPLSKEEQELQGARCMACGVPFCQSGQMLMGMASGCPLHNLVPEWNDLIFQENWEEAYYRLQKDEQLSGIYIKGMSGTL